MKASPAPPHVLGSFHVLEPIGRGGTAMVYLAEPCEGSRDFGPAGRQYAVKVRERGQGEVDARFMREIDMLRGLDLPGVVRIHESGADEHLLWFAMDRVNGTNIRRRIMDAGDVPARCERAARLGSDLLRILSTVHRYGLIHRDLKPSNVLVSDADEVTVLDFGVARRTASADTLTRPGTVVGTLPFMAPEQVSGLPLTPGVDVFAAGLLLYEGVLGPRPDQPSPHEWLSHQCLQRLPSMAGLHREVPRDLSALIDHMLLLDPLDRPTADEAARRLRAIVEATPRAVPEWPEPHRFHGRTEELEAAIRVLDGQGPNIVYVHGPAGSGRARLVEQIRRQALLRGARCLRASTHQSEPGGAFGKILRQLFETPNDRNWRRTVAGPDVPRLLEMWPDLPLIAAGAADGTRSDLTAIAEAAVQCLLRATDRHPLLVVVENFDQVDLITQRVLRALGDTRSGRLNLMVVADDRWMDARANRLVGRWRDSGAAIELLARDLSAEDAALLAQDLVPAARMREPGACSPLRALEHGLEAMAHWRGEAPPRLTVEVLPLGLAVAPVDGVALQDLGIDPAPLVRAGVLSGDDRRGYWLATRVQSRLARALLEDRQGAADRLADALEKSLARAGPTRVGNLVARIAHHRLQGRSPGRALGPAIRAALEATETENWAEARRWLLVVDGLPRDANDPIYAASRFELAFSRARVSLATDPNRVREDLVTQALDRAWSEDERVKANLLLAERDARRGMLEEAAATSERVAEAVGIDNPELAARATLQAARFRLAQGRPEEVMQTLEVGRRLLGHNHAGPLSVNLELTRAYAEHAAGHGERAAATCRTGMALALAKDMGIHASRFQLRLGAALLRLGDRRGAEACCLEALEHLRARDQPDGVAEGVLQLCRLAEGRGALEAARSLLNESLQVAERLEHPQLIARCMEARLSLACAVGSTRDATNAMERYRTLHYTLPTWPAVLGAWHRVAGAPSKAIQVVAPLASREHARFSRVCAAIELARAHLDLGQPQQAEEAARQAARDAQLMGFIDLALLARLVVGAAAPHADTSFDYAVARALSSPWVVHRLTAMEMDGRRRAARGDRQGASLRFARLRDAANELGFHTAVGLADRWLGTITEGSPA